MRLFVADAAGTRWDELTAGGGPAVRLTAPDLQRAQRMTAGAHDDDARVAVILDIAVAVPGHFRTGGAEGTVRYAGTLDGLVGLICDIDAAAVADGVTLVPAPGVPDADLRRLGCDVLARLAGRYRVSA